MGLVRPQRDRGKAPLASELTSLAIGRPQHLEKFLERVAHLLRHAEHPVDDL